MSQCVYPSIKCEVIYSGIVIFYVIKANDNVCFFILLGGNAHKNPGPLSFCHWNLGGLPTDNVLKKILLQAFLRVNDFDIVILGGTHLSSKIDENELNIDGYSFQRCDHPDHISRGELAFIINHLFLAFLNLK